MVGSLIDLIRDNLEGLYQRWSESPPRPDWRNLGFILLGAVLLLPLTLRLPMLGYDWHRLFYLGVLEPYPPWMVPLFQPFRLVPWRDSLALVNGISLLTVALLTACQAESVRWSGLGAALMALLTPPLWFMLWDGQIDGLILAGLLVLPWSVPLALLRPQILGWLLLTRRRWTLAMGAWLGLSFLLWGWWLGVALPQSVGSVVHPTAMGWATLGWPILLVGLWMLLRSGNNPWRLLAASMLASPYLQPYHMVLLLPSLGVVKGWRRWMLWGWVWVVGFVPGFLGWSRYLGLGFPLAVWILLRDEHGSDFCGS